MNSALTRGHMRRIAATIDRRWARDGLYVRAVVMGSGCDLFIVALNTCVSHISVEWWPGAVTHTARRLLYDPLAYAYT